MAADANFSRIEQLFHEALALPDADRDAFLRTGCDERTAEEVRALLRAHTGDPAFMREPLVRSLATLDDELPLGSRIGDYEITARLGSGGMGDVYRARHLRLQCDHAIKVLRGRGTAAADARLLSEARHAARLTHPNICTVYHVGEHEGRTYVVMELVQGVTLEQRLRGGPLPIDAARRYALEIADALAHAHASGVVHGDLKPANIMVTPHGHVKVLDFGVARLMPGAASDLTGPAPERPFGGTLRYMPPEAFRNEPVDARGDLWSLGVVLYEMVSGAGPFGGDSPYELSSSILRDVPAPFDAAVPATFDAVARRCLEKDVGRRYQTAGEVRAALEAIEPRHTRHAAPLGRVWRRAAIAVLAILVSSMVWWAAGRPDTAGDRVSIAVLPLESLSGPGDEYFADGVTEVLIGDLAQVRALRVISRQSTMAYRGTKTPAAEIARTLGVDYLVNGTVTRAGGQVRITAQLVDPFEDEHLWSNAFTRPVEDVLTLQNEVAREIARHVAVTIRPEEERRFAERRPVRPDALEAYLRGRALWNMRSKRALEQATEAFHTAIQLDPTLAQSYSGLADTYAVQASLGFVPPEGYQLSRTHARTALKLDPALVEPHASLGRVKFSFDWDPEGAEQEFQAALSRKPNYATARQWYAVFLATRGRLDDALNEARGAAESNPLSPVIHWNVARTHFFRREYAAALAALARALELDPDFAMAHVLAARVHAQQQRPADAQRALERVRETERTSEWLAMNAYVAAVRGDRRTALRLLERVHEDTPPKHVVPYYAAKVHTALNDPDKAFASLQRAIHGRSSRAVFVAVDPELAPLRRDPRFDPLAQAVGVAPAQ